MKKIKSLQKRCELSLEATPPFNFKYTVCKPSHFPTKLESFDDVNEIFYRTLRLNQKKVVGLRMRSLDKIKPKQGIYAEVYSDETLSKEDIAQLENRISDSFGLQGDINDFYKLIKKRDLLQHPIKCLYGMRSSCFENLFEILNISSMLQNTTVKRSEQMMHAMLSNFGQRVNFDGREFYAFYTPQDIVKSNEQRLRELKLGYRAKFLMGIADYFIKNPDLEEKIKLMPIDDAKNELMEIKGIGPYSANTTLFAYCRNPSLINFDVWNRKIFSKFLFGTETEDVEKILTEFERKYGHYKGYAALYILEDLFVKKPELQYWRKNDNV